MTAVELARDDVFRKNWPYVSERLEKYLTQRQLDFSKEHSGQYELIGRYVEFQQDLFASLADLNKLVQGPPPTAAPPKRLNNVHFKPPAHTPKPIATPTHGQESNPT